jgi:putative transposase
MKFAFIAEQRETWPVSALCKFLGVSRQGFYEFQRKPQTKRAQASRELDGEVLRVFEKHRGRYGVPRVRETLKQEHNLRVGKRRIEESMVRQGLFAKKKRKFVVTTKADEAYAHPPNVLAREFVAARPNERWVTDITYLRTAEGWLYLAAIIDLCTRKVVGWSLGSELDTSLAVRALDMALAQRTSKEPLLHHSDRGCQYTSVLYMGLLDAAGVEVSMSRKGDCWDNAVAESFFATIKKELVHRQEWATRAELELAVFAYIEAYYNRRRLHSSLGYRTPSQVEQTFRAA